MNTHVLMISGGLVLACIGMVIYFFGRNRTYTHTAAVKGIVTGAEEVEVVTADRKGNEIRGTNHLTYFSYKAGDKEKNGFGYTKSRYTAGQSINLKYDPDNDDDCIEAVQEGGNPVRAAGAIMILGFIIMAAGLLTM